MSSNKKDFLDYYIWKEKYSTYLNKYYNNIISQLKPYYITETSFFDNFCKLIYYNSSHKKDKWI